MNDCFEKVLTSANGKELRENFVDLEQCLAICLDKRRKIYLS